MKHSQSIAYALAAVLCASAAGFPLLGGGGFDLTWHTIDQHFGIFMLPTVYSIPLAIICSGLLWLYCGTALLWSAFS